MKPCLIYLFLLHIVSCLTNFIQDHAMSVASMKSLVELEGLLLDELTSYAEAVQSKIEKIESFLEEVHLKKQQYDVSREDYVAHPLNGYSLIRRLHEDWSYFEYYMRESLGGPIIENVKSLLFKKAPSVKDTEDAMKGLVRIQSYYDLDASNLSQGIIADRQYNSKLTTLDCIAMAKYLDEMKIMPTALDWYKEALEQFNSTKDGELYAQVYHLTVQDLYEDYVGILLMKGRSKDALNLLNKVSDLYVGLWEKRRTAEEYAEFPDTATEYLKLPLDAVQKGCRNMFTPSVNLSCYFEVDMSHFLKLAPIKVELLSLEPYIAVYHDVIYDNEIKKLLDVELCSLIHDRSEEHNNSFKYTIVENDVTDVLNYRVMDMTGMTVEYDNDFQLINYGVGGHTSVHHDSWFLNEQQPGRGQLLATVLFFLSDVPQGGATVFPELQIDFKPTKGAALVWHNLDEQLNDHYALEHLSCPVIVGSKWTLVKWLREQ